MIRPFVAALALSPLVLAALASAAPAQDIAWPAPTPGLCGQPAELSYRLDAQLQFDTIDMQLPLEMRRAEPAYVEFRVPDAAEITLTATANDDSDPYLTLYDNFGRIVGEDDDGGGGFDSRLVVTLDPGAYCAQVRTLGVPYPMGAISFAMVAGAAPFDGGGGGGGRLPAFDANAACTDPAQQIDAGGLRVGVGRRTFDGRIEAGGGQAWRLALPDGGPLQIDLASPDFDTVLEVYDTAGNWLAENDDGPSGTDSQVAQAFEPGELCVAVRSYADEGGGDYALSLALVEGGFPDIGGGDIGVCADPANTADFGAPLTGGTISLSGQFAGVPETYVRLSVPDGGEVRIDLASDAFDTLLALYDGDGAMIVENDDGPNSGTDSQIAESLAPGTYCLGVRAFGAGEGAFQLVATAQGGGTGGSVAALPDPAAQLEELGALDGVLRSSLVTTDKTLWVAFDLAQEAGVQVDATSLSGAFTLRLVSEGGDPVIEARSAGALNSARLEVALMPGRYLVAQESHADDGATKVRQIIVTRR